jgi:glutathione S-transferase
VFAPVLRYFDTFDRIGDFGVFDGLAKVPAWRAALAVRPSVRDAVGPNHDERLFRFLLGRGGGLARLMPPAETTLRRSA